MLPSPSPLLQASVKIPVPSELPGRQRLVAILLALGILLTVLELVRQRKLREEYSALWLATAGFLLLLAIEYRVLLWITDLIGAVLPTSTLFFGGLVFLILLSLQFSVRLSRLTYRSRAQTRRIAFLEERIRKLEEGTDPAREEEGEDPRRDGA